MPTSTPTPLSDQRYGVVMHSTSSSETEYFLDELGLNWYLQFNPDMSNIPTGASKMPFIRVPTDSDVWNSGETASIESLSDAEIADLGFLTPSQIQSLAQSAPGSYWYIFGEANRYGYITGMRWAPVFHYFVTHLKAADPTAKIIGTSILNWDYTCIGCLGPGEVGGYEPGKDWLDEFIETYEMSYGEKPPVNIWAIDVYPLDWTNTPNGPQHAIIAASQLEGMRDYLDDIPEYDDTPIWITEIAVHVGYEGYDIQGSDIVPTGQYNWDSMGDYLVAVLDWLEDNAASHQIEKWFFFTTYKNIVDVGGDGYMGIIFFEGPDEGDPLTCLGEIYRARALDEPRVRCDASGNAVPE